MPSVVIVGGGFAGFALFNKLERSLDASTTTLTLITPRKHLVHLPAVLRMLVTADRELESRILLPLTNRLNEGNRKVITETVSSIVDNDEKGRHVVLNNGDQIPYDVLALATGSRWDGCLDFPEDAEDIHQHNKKWRERFSAARSIVLVGGGGVSFGKQPPLVCTT